jgi:hypothetical protein
MGYRVFTDGDHGPHKERYQICTGKIMDGGKEYRHYSGDCQPKDNSPIMYNRLEVDAWVERQKPAVPRQRK